MFLSLYDSQKNIILSPERMHEILLDAQPVSLKNNAGRYLAQCGIIGNKLANDVVFLPKVKLKHMKRAYGCILFKFRNAYGEISRLELYTLVTKSSKIRVRDKIVIIADDISFDQEAFRATAMPFLAISDSLEEAILMKSETEWSVWVVSERSMNRGFSVPSNIKEFVLLADELNPYFLSHFPESFVSRLEENSRFKGTIKRMAFESFSRPPTPYCLNSAT